MKHKLKETPIRIDAEVQARLLNRYVAYGVERIYNTKGTLAENVPTKTRHFYQFQWRNVKADILGLFKNPRVIYPKVAWSLAAFVFILLGKHDAAYHTAFLMGTTVAFDAAQQESGTGEPSTITINITIGAGTNRLATVHVSGLSGGITTTFDGNTTSVAVTTGGSLHSDYWINPGTGSKACVCSGGNIKVIAAISFTGADQTTPIGATTSNTSLTSPQAVALTTTQDNSMRVDVISEQNDNSSDPGIATLDNGTSRFSSFNQQNQFQNRIIGYTTPITTHGAATNTWTFSCITKSLVAFEVVPASGGTVVTVIQPRKMMFGIGA